MKTCIKRVYCPYDRKMVHCREEKANGSARIMCQKCGRLLWTKSSTNWKYEARGVIH